MRRPIPLRRTNLRAAHFRLIGEITVLSGMIEDTLKRMPLAMLRIRPVPGIAFTAHLKASSLCDIILAITPYVIALEDLNQEVEAAIKAVRMASDKRNVIVHGPFDFFSGSESARVQRFKARSKITLSEDHFGELALKEALQLHIDAWERIADCYVGMSALAEERERRGESPLRPDFVEQANRQTPSEPSPEDRG